MVNISDGSFDIVNRLNNKPHGRCINIDSDGGMFIGHHKDGSNWAVGNSIRIVSDGDIQVGEKYMANREMYQRGTIY